MERNLPEPPEIGQADTAVHGVVSRIREHYLATGEITQTQWFILLEVNRKKLERECNWLEAA
jgi:hypothetical protein